MELMGLKTESKGPGGLERSEGENGQAEEEKEERGEGGGDLNNRRGKKKERIVYFDHSHRRGHLKGKNRYKGRKTNARRDYIKGPMTHVL